MHAMIFTAPPQSLLDAGLFVDQVGRAIADAAPADAELILRTRADLDISDAAAVAATLVQTPVDWILNAAAYTAVDRAETDAAAA